MAAGTRRPGTRAQSGPIGYVLVFAIVMAGMAIIVLIGVSGLSETQSQSKIQRAEHSMTLFDSRAAMVALGDSNGQTISFGQGGGTFEVQDESGWMRIVHNNYSEDDDDEREVIYNKSMGALLYENGDQSLAYQGGGVWRHAPDGEARMISPPEFHYRGATLTLPIIRTLGGGNAKGSVDVSIQPQKQAELVFPARSPPTAGDEIGVPYNGTERNYTNPIRNGTVNVSVRSDYYEAWATYFRDRTTGEVTVWDSNRTVRLQLKSIGGPPGSFTIPEEGESVPADGIANGHPLKEFEFDIVYTNGNNDHFSLYDEKNNEEYELHVLPTGNNYHNSCPGSPPDSDVYVGMYYYSGDGSGEYEYWEGEIDPSNSAISWSCTSDGPQLSIDMLSDSVDMDYDQNAPGISCGGGPGGGNKWRFGEHIKCDYSHGDATLDQHAGAGVGWEPTIQYSAGDTSTGRTLDEIVNHYTSLMGPDIDMTSQMGPGNSRAIVQDASSGTLTYETASGAQYITYLHVTENEIAVEFD